MQDRYVFPAVFSYAGDGISVEFPDLPGCFSCGQNDAEALDMARGALGLHLYGMECDQEVIPSPSRLPVLTVGSSQALVLVDVWMPPIRRATLDRAVKKTLTLPKWLNDLAEKNQVNFSHLLQEALKTHLGIGDHKRQ